MNECVKRKPREMLWRYNLPQMLSFDRENASLLCQFCGIAGKPHKRREDCIDALRSEIAGLQFRRVAGGGRKPDGAATVNSAGSDNVTLLGASYRPARRGPKCFCGRCNACIVRARRHAVRDAAEAKVASAAGTL